jgi:hypothetical protein
MELYNHLELLLEMLHSAADKLVPTFPCRKETKLGRNTQNIYLKHRYLLNKNVMPEITYELLNKISNQPKIRIKIPSNFQF